LHDLMEVKVEEEKSREDAKKRKENHAFASASASFIKTFVLFLPVFGTVGIGVLPILARLGYLLSAGTSLLDYKRDVPIAHPHGG
jgi:hypothetical protein